MLLFSFLCKNYFPNCQLQDQKTTRVYGDDMKGDKRTETLCCTGNDVTGDKAQ